MFAEHCQLCLLTLCCSGLLLQDSVRTNIAHHMAYAHQCATEASVRFLEAFRRYNYTTPKSYLELISLYKQLLDVSGGGCCCVHALVQAITRL